MYAVSQEFMDAMRAQRRQVLAKVVIDYTDPLIDQSIQVDASERARISWPEQTADGLTQAPYMWASLDGSWTLDQFRRPMPDTEELADLYQVGWWGEQIAGIGGAFAEPYPTLTVTHTPRPVHSLKVVGENQFSEYPVDFTIRLRDGLGVLLHEEVVTGNDSLTWSKVLEAPILDVVSQELEIHKWSHEGRQAKILEFFSSVQQTHEDDLIAVSLLEEREVSQGSLPVGNISSNEIVVRLSNEDRRFDPDNETSPLNGLLLPNRRVRAWLGAEVNGDTEWVPLGTFWSVEWGTESDVLEAAVRALDRLEHLRKSIYRTSVVQQNVTAAALAQAILLDAGLSSVDWVIEDEVNDVVFPWAWFEPVSHREALRLLAEAAMAVVYCDRDGRVRIGASAVVLPDEETGPWYLQGGSFPAETTVQPVFGIGPDDYFAPLRAPSRQDQVANEIVVTARPVAPAGSPEEVYRSSSPITVPAGQIVTVTAQYQQPPVKDATASLDSPPPDVSIVDARYYAWGAEVDIQNTGGSDADVTLVITGTRLVAWAGERVVTRDENSQALNGRIVFEFPENHLIQTRAQAQTIAQALLASFKDPRRDIEIEWRGNPALELGDPVTIITDMVRDRRSEYVIVRQELEWAGYLRARMTGRRVTS
jgi:hypothetical protein